MLAGTGAALLLSCGNANTTHKAAEAPETKLVFDKLVGTWQSEDKLSYERWTRNADGSFHSSVYSVKGKDTVFMEQADIFKKDGKWIFENIVRDQNKGQKTRFTSGNMDENTIQFTNPEHDFPNEIHYTLPDNQHIKAFIVGKNEQGGMDTIPFNYVRMN